MTTAHELPFLAPIPRGHEVLIVKFSLAGKSPSLVLDRTASSLYCPEALWAPLHQDPALAVTDPVALVTRFAWVVKSAVEGLCAGALVATTAGHDRYDVKTILLLEPPALPYR